MFELWVLSKNITSSFRILCADMTPYLFNKCSVGALGKYEVHLEDFQSFLVLVDPAVFTKLLKQTILTTCYCLSLWDCKHSCHVDGCCGTSKPGNICRIKTRRPAMSSYVWVTVEVSTTKWKAVCVELQNEGSQGWLHTRIPTLQRSGETTATIR